MARRRWGLHWGCCWRTISGCGAIGVVTMAVLGASVRFWPWASGRFRWCMGSISPLRERAGKGGSAWDCAGALGGVGYSVLATFVTLFYVSRHWDGAALCLTTFGVAFIAARVMFIHAIDRWGGFKVEEMVCLTVESAGGCFCCGGRSRRVWRLAAAAITGFGFSLVFPAVGVEAVRGVPEQNAAGRRWGFSRGLRMFRSSWWVRRRAR